MKIGILLQHFGPDADRDSVIMVAPALERAGFDSVWVRDHLMFRPHTFEASDTTFMEPFTTLAAIGAVTEEIMLGTAVTIPFRHPLVTSQLYGGIASASRSDRIIAGIGAGTPRTPFEATGQDFDRRVQAVKELAEILRLTWSGEPVCYHGELWQFDDILLDPTPAPDSPIWYGGASPAAVRRSIEYCDGWLAGKCPLTVFDKLHAQLRLADPDGERVKTVAISPVISVAENRARALEHINIEGLLVEARSNRLWAGSFETVDDLEGLIVAGNADECVEQLLGLHARGVDHVILDLRFRSSEFADQAMAIGEEILPAVRARVDTWAESAGA